MDREAWKATVHGVTKSWTQLNMRAYARHHAMLLSLGLAPLSHWPENLYYQPSVKQSCFDSCNRLNLMIFHW